jgi:hypothetical protein
MINLYSFIMSKNTCIHRKEELKKSKRDQKSYIDLVQEGLLRKEVIQPHLPVRLPCYDFAPVISLTFDDSW